MSRRLSEFLAQLPPSGPARVAVVASIVLGGVIAACLTVLIAIFLVTAYGAR